MTSSPSLTAVWPATSQRDAPADGGGSTAGPGNGRFRAGGPSRHADQARIAETAGTVIVHSDRGSQFRSAAFVRTLRSNGLTGSMGRVGACGDNAAMESFFALLQKNVLDRQRWSGREQLRLAIITWIEWTYHRRRRQRRLGRLTPIEYETINRATQAA